MLLDRYLDMLTELKDFICHQEAMLNEKDEIIKNLEAQVEELQYELDDRKGL